MKVTAEDFEPRRDGWFEHAGTWGEVTVGTVIANPERRSERWEVIEVAHGLQTQHGDTLWMRAREQTTGAEHTIRPHLKIKPVTILTQSPLDTQTPPVTPASDAEAIALLVERLGATHLATRDHETGEITCPDYNASFTGHGGEGNIMDQQLEHLRFAHGVDTTDFEKMTPEQQIQEVWLYHGRCHNPAYEFGKGGFPHRHVPEDLSMYTGKK